MSKYLHNVIRDAISSHRKLLSIFVTAGFPERSATAEIILMLEKSGVDFIELGIPFSDPIADGPIIQEASAISLKNGTNLPFIFKELNNIRNQSRIPILLMGYFNPIFQFGIERFLKQCAAVQVDGLIIPDWTIEEAESYFPLMKQYDVDYIPLIAPNTPLSRIQEIDQKINSFIYCVAYTGVTGRDNKPSTEILHFIKTVKSLITHPLFIGFGVKHHRDYLIYSDVSDGVIIGSAFIQKLKVTPPNEYRKTIAEFVRNIREGNHK